jgi:hypothetical protein
MKCFNRLSGMSKSDRMISLGSTPTATPIRGFKTDRHYLGDTETGGSYENWTMGVKLMTADPQATAMPSPQQIRNAVAAVDDEVLCRLSVPADERHVRVLLNVARAYLQALETVSAENAGR